MPYWYQAILRDAPDAATPTADAIYRHSGSARSRALTWVRTEPESLRSVYVGPLRTGPRCSLSSRVSPIAQNRAQRDATRPPGFAHWAPWASCFMSGRWARLMILWGAFA